MQSGGASTTVLRKVSVRVVSNSNCLNKYSVRGLEVTENMICAAIPAGIHLICLLIGDNVLLNRI